MQFLERIAEHGWTVARRIVVALVGGAVLLVGVIMMVTPGPAIVVIPAGLAILALEFAWARHALNRIRDFIRRKERDPEPPDGESTPGPAAPPPAGGSRLQLDSSDS